MFGKRLKSLRKKKSITQAELAEVLNVSQQAVGFWERDRNLPSNQTLMQMADYFHVSIDYLIGTDTTPNPQIDDILQDLFGDNPDIMKFLKDHNFSMSGELSLIGSEEKTLLKHAILSSMVKAKNFAAAHNITDTKK